MEVVNDLASGEIIWQESEPLDDDEIQVGVAISSDNEDFLDDEEDDDGDDDDDDDGDDGNDDDVASRAQLVSLFIDDLMQGQLNPAESQSQA